MLITCPHCDTRLDLRHRPKSPAIDCPSCLRTLYVPADLCEPPPTNFAEELAERRSRPSGAATLVRGLLRLAVGAASTLVLCVVLWTRKDDIAAWWQSLTAPPPPVAPLAVPVEPVPEPEAEEDDPFNGKAPIDVITERLRRARAVDMPDGTRIIVIPPD